MKKIQCPRFNSGDHVLIRVSDKKSCFHNKTATISEVVEDISFTEPHYKFVINNTT